jgi:hypothetical protein
MNNAAASRQATQIAQKENAKAKVSALLNSSSSAINLAANTGQYQCFVKIKGYSDTEISLVVEALRKLGYVAKKASQEPFLDISW